MRWFAIPSRACSAPTRPAVRRWPVRAVLAQLRAPGALARDLANLHLLARVVQPGRKASGEVGNSRDLPVPPGCYEAIYGNMARIGLAAAAGHVPIARRGQSAAYRGLASGSPTRC